MNFGVSYLPYSIAPHTFPLNVFTHSAFCSCQAPLTVLKRMKELGVDTQLCLYVIILPCEFRQS